MPPGELAEPTRARIPRAQGVSGEITAESLAGEGSDTRPRSPLGSACLRGRKDERARDWSGAPCPTHFVQGIAYTITGADPNVGAA